VPSPLFISLFCKFLCICGVIAPLTNLRSSYRSPFIDLLWYIIRKLRRIHGRMIGPGKMEARQEQLAMKQIRRRQARDVQAVMWLLDNINKSNKIETLVLASPGTFDQEWGREAWKAISAQGDSQPDRRGAQPTPPTGGHDHPYPGLPSRPVHPKEPWLVISADMCSTCLRPTMTKGIP
jgi:hypothetical protein